MWPSSQLTITVPCCSFLFRPFLAFRSSKARVVLVGANTTFPHNHTERQEDVWYWYGVFSPSIFLGKNELEKPRMIPTLPCPDVEREQNLAAVVTCEQIHT